MLRDRISFVCVGRHPNERVHYVTVDNVGGARVAVEHLIRTTWIQRATRVRPEDREWKARIVQADGQVIEKIVEV